MLTMAARIWARSPSGSPGMVAVEVLGDDDPEHRVAEELEPFVRLLARHLGAVGAVAQGEVQEPRVDGGGAETRLEPGACFPGHVGSLPRGLPPGARAGRRGFRQAASSFAVT